MGLIKDISAGFLIFSGIAFAQSLGPVSIGIKAGIPITDAFYNTSVGPGQKLYSNSQNYLLGPSIELRLPYRTSVEFDALYRPLTYGTSTATVVNGTPVLSRTSDDLSSWEFPLMFKYHLVSERAMKPYVEVGPSFRTGARQLGYLSSTGVTAGVGADFKAPLIRLRLSPELRYTHWAGDGSHNIATIPLASRQDQVEFLFGISF